MIKKKSIYWELWMPFSLRIIYVLYVINIFDVLFAKSLKCDCLVTVYGSYLVIILVTLCSWPLTYLLHINGMGIS